MEIFFHLVETGELDQSMLEALKEETDKIEKKFATPVRRLPVWSRWAAAAVILALGLATGSYFFLSGKGATVNGGAHQTIIANDVKPGSNKAVLTLANGKKIMLDSAANGSLGSQGNVDILKKGNGQIVYDARGNADGKGELNTIATPRGGQFMIELSDGTKVWLNAESSLQYPTAFTGTLRNVALKGEAYFEVAPNKQMPFMVSAAGTNVMALGTDFNINAYGDDNLINTTLLDGSVKCSRGNREVLIVPGEQAAINGDEPFAVTKVDVEGVVAWKNGRFHFTNAGINSILHQISRWYDLDVIYEGAIPKDRYSGEVPRTVNVSSILQILEASGTRIRIEGKKIVVLP